MASDLNKVIIIGRLTRDPELRYTQSGTAVCSFSIASNYSYTSNGDKKEQVSFFNCVCWAKGGEIIAEYMKKGSRIGIEGRLQQRTWEDNEGKKRQIVEIVVDAFQFLSASKKDDGTGGSSSNNHADNPFSDEDVPF